MFDYLAMPYKDSDYTIVIALVCWPKRMNFGAETHLGGGGMSTFVLPSTAIAWRPTLTFVGSTALRRGPWGL